MEQDRKIRVAITHGDTNGVGYELIFKIFEDPAMLELCTPMALPRWPLITVRH